MRAIRRHHRWNHEARAIAIGVLIGFAVAAAWLLSTVHGQTTQPTLARVYTWQPLDVETPPHIRPAVTLHRIEHDPVAIAKQHGYQPGDRVGVILNPAEDQLPAIKKSVAEYKADDRDKLARYVPLLEWMADRVIALHEAGYVIDVVACDFEGWQTPWSLKAGLDAMYGKDAIGKHRQRIIDDSQRGHELLAYRIERSLIAPLRAAGIDAPVINYGHTIRPAGAVDNDGWPLPGGAVGGIPSPVLYGSWPDPMRADLAALLAAGDCIPWVGESVDPLVVRLAMRQCPIVLYFTPGHDTDRQRQMVEAMSN